jgi:ABC-type multidrug transport system ATPase subunit
MDAVVINNITMGAAGPNHALNQQARQALARLGAFPSREAQSNAALSDISLRVHAGELFAILGSHAAGKTTLLQLIAGEIQPDFGRIEVFGWDTVTEAGRVARLVTSARIDSILLGRLSPVENLTYHARLEGVYAADTCLNSRTLLSMLGVEPQSMDEPLSSLPATAQRKVALARALQTPARLLLLDDPFAGFDPCDRRQAWQAVQRCHRQAGRTTIFASRDLADVKALSDRVGVLERGCLVALGVPGEVLPLDLPLPQDCYSMAA